MTENCIYCRIHVMRPTCIISLKLIKTKGDGNGCKATEVYVISY